MELQNTLYVTTENAFLRLDHDTVRIEAERATVLRVPLIHLEALVCFGNVLVSTALIHRCGEDGRSIVFLSRSGRFKARLVGPVGGNVLLRRAQHEMLGMPARSGEIVRSMVGGKIQNARQLLLRSARDARDGGDRRSLQDGAESLAATLIRLRTARDTDGMRGFEGDAARAYFGCFSSMVRPGVAGFRMEARTRRPPLDALNAVLSFVYALVLSECVGALESVGLDPQVGYLHALRPGKPALALDLMEELRPAIADRLVLALVNRRQLTEKDFAGEEGGAVLLNEVGRRTVVAAYQQRKSEQVRHVVLDRQLPIGLVPHVQARLLARHLRGDLADYYPFVMR